MKHRSRRERVGNCHRHGRVACQAKKGKSHPFAALIIHQSLPVRYSISLIKRRGHHQPGSPAIKDDGECCQHASICACGVSDRQQVGAVRRAIAAERAGFRRCRARRGPRRSSGRGTRGGHDELDVRLGDPLEVFEGRDRVAEDLRAGGAGRARSGSSRRRPRPRGSGSCRPGPRSTTLTFSSGSLTVRRAFRIVSWSIIGCSSDGAERAGLRRSDGRGPAVVEVAASLQSSSGDVDVVAADLDAVGGDRLERREAEGACPSGRRTGPRGAGTGSRSRRGRPRPAGRRRGCRRRRSRRTCHRR